MTLIAHSEVIFIPCCLLIIIIVRGVDVYGVEVWLAQSVIVSRPLLVLILLLIHIHNLGGMLRGLGKLSVVWFLPLNRVWHQFEGLIKVVALRTKSFLRISSL